MDDKERESEYKTRKIEELTSDNAEKDKQIVELTSENRTLKDRISALEIDQSQFEELEKQLAIYKRALRTACLVKGSCRSCWEKHDKRCNGMCNGDVKVCIEHFIQRAEKEMEEQDNA